MQFVSCHNGQIFTSTASQWNSPSARTRFQIGLPAIDDLLPGGGFSRGGIHEILSHPVHGTPRFFSLLLAKASGGTIVWCDPEGTLYPPAIAAAGVAMEKLFLLHPKTQA